MNIHVVFCPSVAKHWDWQPIAQLPRASDYSMPILNISGSGSPTCSYNNTYHPPRTCEENMLVNWRRSWPWTSGWLLQTFQVVILSEFYYWQGLKSCMNSIFSRWVNMWEKIILKYLVWSLKEKKKCIEDQLLVRNFFLKIDLKQRMQGVYFHPCFPCYIRGCIFIIKFNLMNFVLSTKVQTLFLAIAL